MHGICTYRKFKFGDYSWNKILKGSQYRGKMRLNNTFYINAGLQHDRNVTKNNFFYFQQLKYQIFEIFE